MSVPAIPISVPSLPTTPEVALTLLQVLFATIGVPTDYNQGSIIRTYSEGIGGVEEVEGVTVQSQALQALVYSAYAAFGISPYSSLPAVGQAVFSTVSMTALPPNISVLIPAGTLIQTNSGIQFATTTTSTLVSGSVSGIFSIQAVIGGSISNVPSGAVNQLVSSLSYPLAVYNPLPTNGGLDAETPSQTLSRFMAKVQSIGLGSPIAIAAAAIGMSYNYEIVKYSCCFEPWVYQLANNVSPLTVGYTVFIDDGAGTASTNLINTVTACLSSGYTTSGGTSIPTPGGIGFRDAGVPFAVSAVVPTSATSFVSGITLNSSLAPIISGAIQQAVTNYFQSLNFGVPAQLSQLTASVADVTFGQLSALTVILGDGSFVAAPSGSIVPPVTGRVILTGSIIELM